MAGPRVAPRQSIHRHQCHVPDPTRVYRSHSTPDPTRVYRSHRAPGSIRPGPRSPPTDPSRADRHRRPTDPTTAHHARSRHRATRHPRHDPRATTWARSPMDRQHAVPPASPPNAILVHRSSRPGRARRPRRTVVERPHRRCPRRSAAPSSGSRLAIRPPTTNRRCDDHPRERLTNPTTTCRKSPRLAVHRRRPVGPVLTRRTDAPRTLDRRCSSVALLALCRVHHPRSARPRPTAGGSRRPLGGGRTNHVRRT